jgi:hypothetical protein
MIRALTDRETLWIVKICETTCVLITLCGFLALSFLYRGGTGTGWLLFLLLIIIVNVPAYFFLKRWLVSRLPEENDDQFLVACSGVEDASPKTILSLRVRASKELGLPVHNLSANLKLSTLRRNVNLFGLMDWKIGDFLEEIIEKHEKRGRPRPPLETVGDVIRALAIIEMDEAP